MKITRVVATWYQAEFARPIENSSFTYTASNKVVIHVHTTEGLIGTGWTNGTGLVMTIAQDMGSRILGRDPIDRESLLASLSDDKVYGRGGLSAKARSAIDIALWDLAGQSCGMPIHRMIGDSRPTVPAYVAGGYYSTGKDHGALVDEALAEVEMGARAFKMKIGLIDVAADLARVGAVRAALDPEVRLLVDANGGYGRDTAAVMARGLADLGVSWFEEPIDSRDVEGQAELRRMVSVPIASGESEHSVTELRHAMQSGAMDIVNADAQCIDGVTGWLKTSSLAAERKLLVAPHGDQEIHVHLAAAAPTGFLVEYYHGANALRESMFVEKLELNVDGTVSSPDRPGLGFVIDEERLAEFRRGSLEASR